MRRITRTLYGAALQAARHLGALHVIPDNGTLNAFMDSFNRNGYAYLADNALQPVLAGTATQAMTAAAYVPATDSDDMKVQYLAIGNMGHKFNPGADANSPPFTSAIPHMARHSGLYGMIPFVMRTIDNDLSPLERTKYRFRVLINHSGTHYFAYFLRVLETSAVTIESKYITVVGGVETEQSFAPTIADLKNPTKPGMAGAPAIDTTGDYLSAAGSLHIELTQNEVNDLKNVAVLLYGTEDQAIISEIALCQGLDKDCYHSFNGTSRDTGTPFPEAIGVQVSTFLSAMYPLTYANEGLTIDLSLGAIEALYGVVA